ncbi:cytochrome c3 family protein [Campylobacter fetus]|uniref:cytochrome c3 family protein n=1 Tax=Campylobacter fetus TaxID=196 RepID=UPI0003C29CEE|nr:cytochrome c3 family protein [Campylobacter fetus]AGZ81723.1 cytochrome c3 [Campylobacter fetus subsp. testudinum 03-427]ALV64880.1 cytochrome c3 [Campylobacter fetus subsp. testudinum Sp3]AVK81126.1 cytochrome c3 [Campylobacter fetus subsp. testudinum]EAI4321299.1 cytochrome c3 [Campylobacter fetus]EAI4390556.1 cytochrome c3 [Campylobacter fetus]
MRNLILSLLILCSFVFGADLNPLKNSKGEITMDFSSNAFPITGVHKKLNLDCKSCHLEADKKDYSAAMQKSCLACHGSYEKIAEATGGLGHNDNIHKSPHYEALDCDNCHKAHQPTINMCLRCHTQDSMKKLQVK